MLDISPYRRKLLVLAGYREDQARGEGGLWVSEESGASEGRGASQAKAVAAITRHDVSAALKAAGPAFTNHFERVMQKAAEVHPDFVNGVEDVGKALHASKATSVNDAYSGTGVKVLVGNIKSADRVIEKALKENYGDLDALRDIVRATIVVDTLDEVDGVVDKLKEHFHVFSDRDRFTYPTSAGYRDRTLNVSLKDQFPAEIQVQVRAMMKAKETLGHQYYEEMRSLDRRPENNVRFKELVRRSQDLYGSTWQQCCATPSTPAKYKLSFALAETHTYHYFIIEDRVYRSPDDAIYDVELWNSTLRAWQPYQGDWAFVLIHATRVSEEYVRRELGISLRVDLDDDFESKHPRGDDGKFVGGEEGSSRAQASTDTVTKGLVRVTAKDGSLWWVKPDRAAEYMSRERPDVKSKGEQDARDRQFYKPTPTEFKEAMQRNPRAATLSQYSDDQLAKMELRMLKGGQAGYALNGDELVNLFNNGGRETRGAGSWLVVDAIERGARRGDHFDGYLTEFYRTLGFKEDRREKNWTPGGADVVYIKWAGGDARTVRARYRRDGRIESK